MKKIYLLFAAGLAFASNSFAQQRMTKVETIKFSTLQTVSKNQLSAQQKTRAYDTLTNHWKLIAPQAVLADTTVLYKSTKGFMAGQNNYEDKAVCQKFDSKYGVTSGGNINSLLFWFGAKIQSAGTAAFTPTIWEDNNGVPGTVLGTGTVFTVAEIDTSSAVRYSIGPSDAIRGKYNVYKYLTTTVPIPSNQIFWAGVTFTYASGDSAGLISSFDNVAQDAPGLTGDFLDAKTHVFSQLKNNSWISFNDDGTEDSWQKDVALAIYPVVSFGTGINEQNINVLSLTNTPNPAKDMTMISYEITNFSEVIISVYDITGKELMSMNQGMQQAGNHLVKINTSELSSGMYFYSLKANEQLLTRKMTVIK
ncbi:MAG: T9SS type A sorting domain-containing protein [Bacteroidota bacterium]